MKRRVPKKNISSRVADIERPEEKEPLRIQKRFSSEDTIDREAAQRFLGRGGDESRAFLERAGGERAGRGPGRDSVFRKKPSIKKFLAAFLVSIVFVLGWFGFRAYERWNDALKLFSDAGTQPGKLAGKTEYGGPDNSAGTKSFFDGFDFRQLTALLGGAGDAYKNFQSISAAALDLAGEFDALENEWPDFLSGNQGDRLIGHLKKMRSDISNIRDSDAKLAKAHSGLGDFFSGASGSPLSFESGLGRFETFLDSLLGLLESPGERHILVFFENSSEMRPGGGFLGSYADVVLKNGSVQNIGVRDINDADRELDAKIVPPKPLQALAARWRAADANWFFDNSLSSGKVIRLMEASKTYSRASTTFDGAIAISPAVLRDVLEATGPVKLADRNIAVDKDNFLLEIQKEVEAGQATGNFPKKILEEFAPVLLDKLAGLQSGEKKLLFRKFGEWLADKDAMLYFKEPGLENFFDFYGVSGKVFELPKNFNGDYLAVVNANIGGGKTDLFIKQKVLFQSQLNLDGTASDHLTVSREHQGDKSSSWWYRAPNEDYLEIFTPPGAGLSNFSGGWDRKIYPKVNYAKSGYATDPLVAQIESGMKKDFNFPLVNVFEESGKNVFAAWVKTDAGKTSAVSFDYKIRLFALPADGRNYQFVFEKQSGSSGEYQFELYAPVGYKWKENHLPVFEYETGDLAGRTIINLTLEKAL